MKWKTKSAVVNTFSSNLQWQLVCRRSLVPRCGGGWDGTAGGPCCWACPGTTGSGTWAALSAASSRAFWAGSDLCCWTCSRGTGTSVQWQEGRQRERILFSWEKWSNQGQSKTRLSPMQRAVGYSERQTLQRALICQISYWFFTFCTISTARAAEKM